MWIDVDDIARDVSTWTKLNCSPVVAGATLAGTWSAALFRQNCRIDGIYVFTSAGTVLRKPAAKQKPYYRGYYEVVERAVLVFSATELTKDKPWDRQAIDETLVLLKSDQQHFVISNEDTSVLRILTVL